MDRVTLPLRTRAAVAAGRSVSELSRRLGAGGGSVIGGRVTLALDPGALATLGRGRAVALVSGTNGKTTTTRLLTAAVGTSVPVASNGAGANLVPGLVGSLSAAGGAAAAVLEVDEGLLAAAIGGLHPGVVVLLNLSRDQLDRIGEVRLHAQSWRRALAAVPSTTVVANADDPLVVWAAGTAGTVRWVATGQRWRADAAGCPACGAHIDWLDQPADTGGDSGAGSGPWACSGCSLARPTEVTTIDSEAVVLDDGRRIPLVLSLPGWFNRANAAMALVAAVSMQPGSDLVTAAHALSQVKTVAGRYEVKRVGTSSVRLLLAKNPAGWAETLDVLRPEPVGLVIGINARVADGRDPSWLWDVKFERLRGRRVVATGDRGRDLAVRLRYAEVDHDYVAGYRRAVAEAGRAEVDLAANYTSFQDARGAL